MRIIRFFIDNLILSSILLIILILAIFILALKIFIFFLPLIITIWIISAIYKGLMNTKPRKKNYIKGKYRVK